MRLIGLLFAAMLFASPALAQPESPAPVEAAEPAPVETVEVDESDSGGTVLVESDGEVTVVDPLVYLSSIGGIALMTVVVVKAAKEGLTNVPLAQAIPLPVYTVVIATVLFVFAVWMEKQPMPLRANEWVAIIIKIVMTAASASGLQSWFTGGVKATPGNSGGQAGRWGTGGTGAVCLALCGSALFMGGCVTQTPMQQALTARESYTTTLNVLTTFRRAGVIDDETAIRIEAARKEVAVALDVLEAAALAAPSNGGDASMQPAWTQFNQALDRLIEWRTRLETRDGPIPATGVNHSRLDGGDRGGDESDRLGAIGKARPHARGNRGGEAGPGPSGSVLDGLAAAFGPVAVMA